MVGLLLGTGAGAEGTGVCRDCLFDGRMKNRQYS